ncbi:hypothetical protein [Conexibacter sp. DBS9H8]|uniref:hypothetical protein n=1 Tax=Conexibacter sp. DBS9H8 TaxID=2937801 RepID=UPI00200BB2C7|nr:hypothetical protein [Conexibacter sp. DBS9H8]
MAGPFLLHRAIRVALGRRAALTSRGVSVFRAPANGSLCMAASDGAQADGSTECAAVTERVVDIEGPRTVPPPGTLRWSEPGGAG